MYFNIVPDYRSDVASRLSGTEPADGHLWLRRSDIISSAFAVDLPPDLGETSAPTYTSQEFLDRGMCDPIVDPVMDDLDRFEYAQNQTFSQRRRAASSAAHATQTADGSSPASEATPPRPESESSDTAD